MNLNNYITILKNNNILLTDLLANEEYSKKAYSIIELNQALINDMLGINEDDKAKKEPKLYLNIAKLLLNYGVFNSYQLKSGKKEAFIKICQKEYERIGRDNFLNCLWRVTKRQQDGKISNIEAYLINSLKKEKSLEA